MAISMRVAPRMFLRRRECVVETGQMTAAETSVLSQQKTVKKHRLFVCLSSRPGVSFERGEGQCLQVLIFTTTSCTQAPRPDPC